MLAGVGMFFIGIDIKSRGRYYQREGKIVQKAISFPNSCTGCNKLLVRAHQFTIHRNQLVFGMESTSHYWLALYTRLMKEDYQVHVITRSSRTRYAVFSYARTKPIPTMLSPLPSLSASVSIPRRKCRRKGVCPTGALPESFLHGRFSI